MLTPRPTLAAIGAGLLLMALWWVLRAPAIEHRPAAAPPEVDIDPPAMRARREAALALAMMPDDPWTFAEAVAASAAGAPAVVSRCGVDQRPRVAEESASDAAPARPAGPGWLAELSRIDAALRNSGDAFDRAVADWMDVDGKWTPAEQLTLVAQRAQTTGDPRVYALAYRACHAEDWRSGAARPAESRVAGCSALSARRWSELDPTNAVPWVYVLSQAVDAGDATAENEALVRMATADRFRDDLHLAAGAIAAHASTEDDGLAADLDLGERAFQKSMGQNESFNRLMDVCRNRAGGDANRAQQCQAIGELMFDHGDNLLLQALGSGMVFLATGDATLREKGRAERSAMSRTWSPATGLSDCRVVRDGIKAMLRNAQVGELAAARERLREGVAP